MTITRLYFRLWVTLAAVFLIVGTIAFGVFDDATTVVLDNLSQLVAWLAATALLSWSAQRSAGVEQRWRLLMAFGAGAWSVGQAVWSWQ